MMELALKGPRWIGEQMGADLDEAFEIGKTRVSLTQFIRHPIKTVKKVAKAWTISTWTKNLSAQLVAEYVWKPRLEHFKTQGNIDDDEFDFILKKWAEKPDGFERDVGFERLEELHKYGHLDDDVWQGIHRQHQWDEFARFRRKPGRYVWQKFFGKRGHLGEGRFYKYTPKKWLGEPLGKALAKTGLGKAVAGIREAAKQVARKVVDTAKKVLGVAAKAVAKVAKKVIIKVAGQAAWAAIHSAVLSALGTVAPGVGNVIGFLAGPFVAKLTEWIIKIACLGCGCATLLFVGSMISIVIAIFGAFRPLEVLEALPGERFVEISKTANGVNPLRLDLGADPLVLFTISYENVGESKLTSVIIEDDYAGDHDGDVIMIVDPGGGVNMGGKLIWNLSDLDSGAGSSVSYRTMIVDTSIEQVIINHATLTAMNEDGETISVSRQGVVIVGEPEGQPPSGWPVDEGCVTQGPYTGDDDSHKIIDAIDIAPVVAGTPGQSIYATHDGTALVYDQPSSTLGKHVVIVSPLGFKSHYGHLDSISVDQDAQVYSGTVIGTMGNTGESSNVHVHYQLVGLKTSEYVPRDSLDGCAGRGACGCCFTSRSARCGE